MFRDTTALHDGVIALRLTRTCDAQPEKQWAPAYYFDICLMDGTPVGKCDLRIGHNARLYIGGNIGYGIDEAHRGHRYATRACLLLFRLAREHGMASLYITCEPTNAASERTCQLAGGTLVEETDIPQDNEMYQAGKRRVKVYRFQL